MNAEVVSLRPLDPKMQALPVLSQLLHKARQHSETWIEDSVALGTKLLEVRSQFPTMRAFEDWIEQTDLQLNHVDRYSLMGMAANVPVMRDVLQNTTLRSWQHIWKIEQVRVRFGRVPSGRPRRCLIGIKQPLPRLTEVMALYQSNKGASSIARVIKARNGAAVWAIILAAVDAGFITANAINFAWPADVNLRALFPTVPSGNAFFTRWRLGNPRHIGYIKSVILPIALDHRETVLAEPLTLEKLVLDHRHKYEAELRAKPEPTIDVTTTALKPIKLAEQPIIMFGKQYWPNCPAGFQTTYDECLSAARLFWGLRHLCEFDDRVFKEPKSRAMAIRAATRPLQRFANKNIIALVDAMSLDMEANPDGACGFPQVPADGVW